MAIGATISVVYILAVGRKEGDRLFIADQEVNLDEMIKLSTASKPLSAYTDKFADEMIVLTLHGKTIAVVTAIKDIDPEPFSLSTNPDSLAIIQNIQ
ncbi:MAG: hypothetical protein SFY66_02260 [Oculatellaceae cyanobacterium bins.114]|nr:hypothetical protein [Oculatellaceae cyanobacterium bins.114]